MKLVIKEKLNHIPHLNDSIDNWNHQLKIGDRLECEAFSSEQEFARIRRHFPIVLREMIIGVVYVWHEMLPKIKATRKMYFFLSGASRRIYSETEILGRICRGGFKIIENEERNGAMRIVAEKRYEPLERVESNVSPILRMKRVGKDGRMFDVYKFRTMHSYSQYLQDYVYEKNKLSESGKLAGDFRVNIWGKLLRPVWLDELPMLMNVMEGSMKWVGVRPLTEHFFSLYTPEMQHLRTRVKPGMLPPFYYEKETPKGLDEIQASERRYIEAYLEHPFRTDWRYFWGTVTNILFRRKHSE